MEGIMQTRRAEVPLLRGLVRYNALIMLVVLFVVSSIMSPAFLSQENLYNLLRQMTPLLFVSLGMLLVINTGGIDLSVGSIAAAGGLLVAMLVPVMPFGGAPGLLLAVVLAVLLGAIFGALNGALVTAFGLAPFIVTLAMMTIARGVTYMMSNGQPTMLPLDLPAADLLNEFGSGTVPFLGVPWPVVLGVVVALLFYFLMNYTTFGRMVIATGSNETAVRLAGISERGYKFCVYVISGALSAVAGIVFTARTGVGTPITGVGLELDGIATCVIGGALLSGGKGSVANTVIGVLVLGLIGNVMNLLSVPVYPQQIIKGVIIVLAVLVQRVGQR
ncbi:ribose ABC transporter membrane subunit [Paraburkholderia unamae]|uniref:ABC transporter permease n=2 Tax=Paraburkholderia unamae TaxID=219649 RepID=UPI000DC405D5|nr:ABC transporter permease [Paraburkholderia unamae]RAR57222.1 monosaccharide ABC transporter membrane protein (CUT2 family) [Paraburkholderia unamae]CAG9243429.1 ribose ABC transporter membrane subunit [Paraburkholderia unamae]